jgi:hypothetical protein
MAMTVKRSKDTKTKRVFVHKIADIRGGVSVNITELGGDYLNEGAVLSAPVAGICHVVKIAEVVAEVGSTDKTIKVKKEHNFKVGDFIMADEGAKAYAITSIDTTNNSYDSITIGTAIGTIPAGGFIIEAAAQSADTSSALKYIPLAVAGTGKPIVSGQNIDTDAWLIGVTTGNPLPGCVSKHLTGIINY